MPEEHQMAIGARIAGLRERQGWSQRALARWVGLDQSAVSRIEAGRRRISAEELHRFADALHVTADVLLKGDAASPIPAVPAPRGPAWPSTREPAMIDALAAAPPWGLEEPAFPASRDALEAPPEPDEPGAARGRRGAAPRLGRRQAMMASPEWLEERALQAARAEARGEGRAGAIARPGEAGATAGEVLARVAGLPGSVVAVAADWFRLRDLAAAQGPPERWSTGHSAEGRPERLVRSPSALRPGAPAGDVLYDRVARFWRSELHVDPEGPLPDLVPLLEDGYGVQVIVARVPPPAAETGGHPQEAAPADRAVAAGAADRPVAAAFTREGVPFIFVNAARPVVLQRFALAHAFAHHVLGHGDVVDRRIEWSRNVPPEAAANDFAEEFLAPVGAVRRWYERRDAPRQVRLEDLLELANAFGVSAWAALFRSRAAGRLQGKPFHVLRGELARQEWEILPRQAFLGGLRDTLSHLTPAESLPPREYGGPAVLRVPAPMRAWTLEAVRGGRLSLEDAAALLRLDVPAFADQLGRLGLE